MSSKHTNVDNLADALVEACAEIVTDDELLSAEPIESVHTRILETAAIYASCRARQAKE